MDWSPLAISIQASLAGTAFAALCGVPAARLVARRRGRSRAVLDGIFTLPMVLPPTVLGFFLLLLFGRNGPLGQALLALGIRIVFSRTATVIAAAVVAFPLVYRTTRASFEQIDRSVLNAARTLGLGERAIFFRLMIPMARPGITAGVILGFARALGEFGATLMLAGNIPGRTQTIPVAIWFAAEGGDMGTALAWVIVIALISFSVVALLNTAGEARQ
jgi:molybdate transport system permease protein